jgi:hypothetical protein
MAPRKDTLVIALYSVPPRLRMDTEDKEMLKEDRSKYTMPLLCVIHHNTKN